MHRYSLYGAGCSTQRNVGWSRIPGFPGHWQHFIFFTSFAVDGPHFSPMYAVFCSSASHMFHMTGGSSCMESWSMHRYSLYGAGCSTQRNVGWSRIPGFPGGWQGFIFLTSFAVVGPHFSPMYAVFRLSASHMSHMTRGTASAATIKTMRPIAVFPSSTIADKFRDREKLWILE